MLLYLLDNPHDSVPKAADYFGWSSEEQTRFDNSVRLAFPLMHMATDGVWYSRITKNAADRRIIYGLIVRLFDPKGLHYNNWLEWEDMSNSRQESSESFPRWKPRVGLEGNIALGYACHFE